MKNKATKRQNYRHTPAFILLFLAKKDLYGAALLNALKEEMPNYSIDSAVIYRTLQELEEEGAVLSYWETDISGPAKKWYKITEKGYDKLKQLRQDILLRKRIFDYFIEEYETLK
ncbi:PadR family transcriptional regulator [Anaerosacchariphilus polymeriproducens]|uniref:PadR family transcriptional regulator n=1 Tax=Anaerosacchariphilus polymeriproducens TaxID=1812858 RepID=A0A371AXY3_9FIRM|nr:PadR family transcriptional regulator [Anaerosacchariphilus polymeriproducens]RDU24407.1 PadR family transcriptional regulator [Anaerosacchariphilus polymeriproducens]